MDLVQANRALRPLRALFETRYADWALSDTLEQCSRGFPLLRKVRSTAATRALYYLNSLDSSRRAKLLRVAWANKHHKNMMSQFSQEEKFLFDSLANALLTPTPEENITESLITARKRMKINKKRLRDEVNDVLLALFRVSPERIGPQEWSFRTNVGEWFIYTLIDIGGKSQLRYEHSIGLGRNLSIGEHIDLQAWMGIGHTKWDQVEEAEIPKAAQGLGEICSHFLSSVPELLKGLSAPINFMAPE